MAASAKSGPQFIFANLPAMLAAVFGSPVPDPDFDAGPSGVYQGWGLLDPRFFYPKDKVTGYPGNVPAFYQMPKYRSIGQIPTALASNNIAAAANAVNGTAMTLAGASLGITLNVPIRPFAQVLGASAPVTAPIVLDFGFAFGNCTAGSAQITVADSTNFTPGQPLVIGGVGNAGGTIPLLTLVASIVDATHITVQAGSIPLATNATAPIGSGDSWGGTEVGFPLPQAHMPYMAAGPGLFLDTRQSVNRGVQITGSAGGAGGNFLVQGWDLSWQPMSELVTVGAGAVTGYSKKCFKAIKAVTPQFSDAHNYSVGTSDVFGFALRTSIYEELLAFWAGSMMVSSQGYTKADTTNPATTTTGDVRGTIQTGAAGGGTGIGATASNGSVSGLALTGNRLDMSSFPGMNAMTQATSSNFLTMFGVTQA